MVCKYLKMVCGKPLCKNSDMTNVKFCPFADTMRKKAPQCCRGYAKKANKAYRDCSSDDVIQKIAHAVWVALPFHNDTVTVTVQNKCGDYVTCQMSPDGRGNWKVHKIRTAVDGASVFKKFRKALFRDAD
jgi:hypothetical protein